jgi:hypothetical protein
MIPNCRFRLDCLLYKLDFNEKINEYNLSFDILKLSIEQLKKSDNFKNIIEVYCKFKKAIF